VLGPLRGARLQLSVTETQWTSSEVLRRALRGATAIGVRQAVAQGLNVAGGVVLANLLSPVEFGLYGIAVFLMHVLAAFGDVGLGGSLIRESETPSEEDYRAVFTAQQALVAVFVLVGFLSMDAIAALFRAEEMIGGLIGAALVAIVLTSFHVIPAVRLERELRFERLAAVEIGQALAFNGTAVAAAAWGRGGEAFAWALVARALAGAVLVQFASPWLPAWRLDAARVRARLRFGLPYQGTLFINLLRESLTPLFVGIVLGEAAVGRIFWAVMLAAYPLLVLHMLGRLFLPAFARLQGRRRDLERVTDVALFAILALAIPAAVGLAVFARPVTLAFFGEQWIESLPIYRLLWFGNLLEPLVIVSLALLNAHGRARETFVFVASLSLGQWVLGVPLILWLGPLGYGLAALLLQPFKLWFIARAVDLAGSGWWRLWWRLWALGFAVGAAAWALQMLAQPEGMAAVTLALLALAAAWFAALALLERERLARALAWLRSEDFAA
jgi:O-antigen/teichoic acid export membrane protein